MLTEAHTFPWMLELFTEPELTALLREHGVRELRSDLGG